MDLIEKLKNGYKQGNVFTKLIYINIGIFLCGKILFAILNKFIGIGWSTWIELPSKFDLFLIISRHPFRRNALYRTNIPPSVVFHNFPPRSL